MEWNMFAPLYSQIVKNVFCEEEQKTSEFKTTLMANIRYKIDNAVVSTSRVALCSGHHYE